MDSTTTERVALMSIHPQYAEAIFEGSKTVEFRKRRLARDIDTVYVYATSPIQRILGSFEIERIDEDSPENIWDKYGTDGMIDEEAFFRYYDGKDSAVAIVVKKTSEFSNPISLKQIEPKTIAPQSFRYIEKRQFSLA